jgi:hypothetical protein
MTSHPLSAPQEQSPLPCPFCGEEARLLGPVMHDTYDLVCNNNHPYFVMRGPRETIVEAWNRRDSSSSPATRGIAPDVAEVLMAEVEDAVESCVVGILARQEVLARINKAVCRMLAQPVASSSAAERETPPDGFGCSACALPLREEDGHGPICTPCIAKARQEVESRRVSHWRS